MADNPGDGYYIGWWPERRRGRIEFLGGTTGFYAVSVRAWTVKQIALAVFNGFLPGVVISALYSSHELVHGSPIAANVN